MIPYNVIQTLIINILRVFLVRQMMELFLSGDDTEGRKTQLGFLAYYLVTAAAYAAFGVSLFYEVCNYLGMAGLTTLYRCPWKRRLWTSLAIFSTDLACFLAVYFAYPQKSLAFGPAIPTLLFLICVTVISHISDPADGREDSLDKRQLCILLSIPAASILILCVLLYGGLEGTEALLICAATLMVNLCVFYLYHLMAENYKNLRENDLYRQQTYAYQNQLEVIMESQGRMKALRHDMKNHILALQALLQKRDWEEADRYLSDMQDFMSNPAEYVATGDDTVDSLLNYKLQRAKEVLNEVEAKISIPEKLMLHSFDLNVVLGNLLDNAVEAARQTGEKRLKVSLKLEKGVLFLCVQNSCRGIAEGKVGRLESTKADPSAHGIGLENVRKIVEKYHGDMELSCENHRMQVDAILYVKEM